MNCCPSTVQKMNDQPTNKRKRDAVEIFQAGLQAVAPDAAIRRFCRLDDNIFTVADRRYNLDLFEKIIVLGAGKAGASMAGSIERIFGERILAGLINVKYGHLAKLRRITVREGGHPVPDHQGLKGAEAIYKLAKTADEKTLVICLISGGGSALMPLPVKGISLADKQKTTRVLLACGATIHEINTVRKHLSTIKGGGLARAIYPATLISLILSDVVGDDLDSIASGPCVPDPTTFHDCKTIFVKYAIEDNIPGTVLDHIAAGIEGNVLETAKKEQAFFKKTQNVIIGRNFDALIHAKKKADELGYNTLLLSSMLEGVTRDVAANHIAIAREIQLHGYPLNRPACILSGGETTVHIQGSGKGGRNQEFVLAAALKLSGLKNITVLSGGTDGTDGPTDAAGAFCNETTVQRALEAGLNPKKFLDNNDSYHFFEKLEDLYKTGPTHTNVMDLRIILLGA